MLATGRTLATDRAFTVGRAFTVDRAADNLLFVDDCLADEELLEWYDIVFIFIYYFLKFLNQPKIIPPYHQSR